MPVRKSQRVKQAKVVRDYTYEELVTIIRFYLEKTYGGLAAFMRHDDFSRFGFEEADKARMFTYLVIPKSSESKRTRSVPMLQRLFNNVLGVGIKAEIVTIRTQVIRSESNKLTMLMDAVTEQGYQ